MLILAAGLAMVVFFGLFNKNGINEKNYYTESEKTEIIEFFHNNYALLNNVKDELGVSNYKTIDIGNDGYITCQDDKGKSTKTWDNRISNDALKYYKLVKFPDPSISYGDLPYSFKNSAKRVDFSFLYHSSASTSIRVGIVYSEVNLSANSSFYENIQDNWYFLKQGLT